MAEAGALAITVVMLCIYLLVNQYCAWGGKPDRRDSASSSDSDSEHERSRLVKEIEKEGRIYGS